MNRRPSRWPVFQGYVLAIVLTVLAVALTFAIESIARISPTLLFFFAAVVTARFAGLGPALLCTGLGAIALSRLFMPFALAGSIPMDPWAHVVNVTAFAIVCTIASVATASLRTARRQLESVLDAISEGFILLDRAWRCDFVNRRATEMTGRRSQELIGKPILAVFPELRNQPGFDQIERAMAERTSVRFEAYYDLFGIWAETTAVPSEEGLSLFIRDVSERRRADEQVARTLGDLQQANQELASLASMLSHDVAQPLGVITSYSELIRGEATDRTRGFAEKIYDTGFRMAALISLYLSYSPLGKKELKRMPVALGGIVQRVKGDMNGVLQEGGMTVSPSELPTVSVDADLMYQFFTQLFGEIARAPRTGPVHLDIDGHQQDGEWVVSVAERVDPDRPPPRGGSGGTGMTMCRRIVELHGGRMWTDLDRGIRVHFALPADPGPTRAIGDGGGAGP